MEGESKASKDNEAEKQKLKRQNHNKTYVKKRKLEVTTLKSTIVVLQQEIDKCRRTASEQQVTTPIAHRQEDLLDACRGWGLDVISKNVSKELAVKGFHESIEGPLNATLVDEKPLNVLQSELQKTYGPRLILMGTSGTGGEALNLAMQMATILKHTRRYGKHKRKSKNPKNFTVGSFGLLHPGNRCVVLPEQVMATSETDNVLQRPEIINIDPMKNLRYPDKMAAVSGSDLTDAQQLLLKKCDVVYFDLFAIWNTDGPEILSSAAVRTSLKICVEYNIITVCDCIPTGLGVTGDPLCAHHYGLNGFDILVLGKGHGLGIVLGQWRSKDEETELRKLQYEMNGWSTSLGWSSQIYFAVHVLRFSRDRIKSAYDEFNKFTQKLMELNAKVKVLGLFYWAPKNHKITQLHFGMGQRGLWAIDFKAVEVISALGKGLAATSECRECNTLTDELVVKCQDCPFYLHPTCAVESESCRCDCCNVRSLSSCEK
jgi:hypothetical protein